MRLHYWPQCSLFKIDFSLMFMLCWHYYQNKIKLSKNIHYNILSTILLPTLSYTASSLVILLLYVVILPSIQFLSIPRSVIKEVSMFFSWDIRHKPLLFTLPVSLKLGQKPMDGSRSCLNRIRIVMVSLIILGIVIFSFFQLFNYLF